MPKLQHQVLKSLLILSFIVFRAFTLVNAQSQWRFPIALEDGIGAKDTIWCIWDTTAHDIFPIDTALGEGAFPFNYNTFNVWIYNANSDSTKVAALTYNGSFGIQVRAFNFQYPLVVSWDSALFHSPILPWSVGVNFARIDNDYFFGVNNDPSIQMFNMLWDNHAFAPSFNWFSQSQFPMHFYISNDPVSVSENILENKIKVFPNPLQDKLYISSMDVIRSIEILNLSGIIVSSEKYNDDNQIQERVLDLINFVPGIYILKTITSLNQINFEKILKLN